MNLGGMKRALSGTYRDLIRHPTFQVSAALSYYFVLSVFPALIFLSAIVGFISLPDLFSHLLLLMGRFLPPDTMKLLYSVLGDVLSYIVEPGFPSECWDGLDESSAFDSMIEALDIAYDVNDDRPFWKTRLLAIALAAIIGTLLRAALGVMVVGPRFGEWLASRLAMSTVFVALWPFLRWTLAICFTILAIEVLYYLAPNVKQRFGATLPGATLSMVIWNGLSFLLGYYFRHWANFNRTYGTLGGFIAFMTWLYWTSFVLLVGAELNAELAKESKKGCVQPKEFVSENRRRITRPAHLTARRSWLLKDFGI